MCTNEANGQKGEREQVRVYLLLILEGKVLPPEGDFITVEDGRIRGVGDGRGWIRVKGQGLKGIRDIT